MDLTHLAAFLGAMARKDIDGMLPHVADDVVLRSPVAAEPFHGKEAMRTVMRGLFAGADGFAFGEIMQGSGHASAFFTVTVGPNTLDGMDYWRLDDRGLVAEMTVFWRPVPAAAAAQQILAGGSTQWH